MRQALSLLLLAGFAGQLLAIEHGMITVDAAGVATKTGGTSGFFLDAGAVPGEYPIRIGADASDDVAGGVLLSSVAEIGRIDPNRVGNTQLQFSNGGTVIDADPLSLNTRSPAGGWSVTTTKMGQAGIPGEPPTAAPNGGDPFGANYGAAYFGYSQGWIGGTFSSSTINTNGTFGALDTYTGAAGVTLDENAFGPGKHRVNIPGVSDPFRQGMLHVNVASNVGRYANVQPAPDGSGYLVATPDSDGFFEFDPSLDPDLVNEDDGVTTPFSFVFIPSGQTGLTSAVVNPSFTSSLGNVGAFSYFETGNGYQVETIDRANAPGQYRLTVNGGSPSQGTLLVNSASDGFTSDNVVTYAPDGDGWIILSEDIESNLLTGNNTTLNELDGLGQNHDLQRPYFSFVYVPNDGAATAAAATPSADSFDRFDRAGVIAWNTEVQVQSNENVPGEVFLNVTDATSGANPFGIGNQKGDHSYGAYGQALTRFDGVMFATISEGFRDNSAFGGFREYGVIGTNQFGDGWSAVTSTADGSPQGEHNIDHSIAFFGADSGFIMGGNVDIPNVSGVDLEQEKTVISIAGVDSLQDGVLIATPYGNDDNYLVAEPLEDGSGWQVLEFDNSVSVESNSSEPDAFSYVYLPYESENLIAGMVAEDGSLLSSTDGAGTEWTLTRESDGRSLPQYRLSITGKSPDDGMLLLTSTGRFASEENFDNSMIYEKDGSDFLIRGLDHITNADTGFVDFQEAGFMFAYIDFENGPIAPPAVGLAGDFNNDGIVDAADYTVWRDNLGGDESTLGGNGDGVGVVDNDDYALWAANYGATSGAVITAVPEPTAIVLLGLAGVAGLAARRCS